MQIGGPGSSGSTGGFSTRLRSINLRPIVGPTDGSQSSTDNPSSGSPDSEDPSAGSTESSDSLLPGASPSDRGISGESSSDGAGFYDAEGRSDSSKSTESGSSSELSPSERRKVQELQRIDSRVRSHEQAHLAAAGSHAQGGISFEYTQGPDGNRYAVGGEVQLDASEASTPEETMQKLRRVKQAALAPANPSPQDLQIAAKASQKLAQAQGEGGSADGSAESDGETENSQSSDPSAESTDSESEESQSPEGVEGPEDIGVDVDRDVGSYIENQNTSGQQGPEGASVQGNNSSENGSSEVTYGPSLAGAGTDAGGTNSPRGQSVNLLI